VGIGEDQALPWVRGQIGSGTFQACAGPSLTRTSCKSLCPVGHSHKGRRDLTVEALVEFHHNRFRVRVARVLNEVLELVKVIVKDKDPLWVWANIQSDGYNT